MAGEHCGQSLAQHHIAGFAQTIKQIGARRVGEIPCLVHLNHLVPGPESFGQGGLRTGGNGLGRERVETQARWQHQAFLRTADGHIHAPCVVLVVGAGQPGNAVNQQERGVARIIDRAAHRSDIAGDPG